MTDKELRRLSRRELLQLLLTQAKDTEELRRLTEEREEQLESLRNNYEHLKRRLDQKDLQIHELRTTLHEERSNRRIELEEAGSIAEAALRLNGIFEMAQRAAEHYLYNIRLLHEKEERRGQELFKESDLETAERSEPEIAREAETVFPEESENGEEETSEPESSEDRTETEPEFPGDMEEAEPEFPEEEWTEAEPEFPDDITAEPETEDPQEDVAEPEAESPEDAPPAGNKEPKGWFRSRKRWARHK